MNAAIPSKPSKTDLMYEVLYNPSFVPLPSPKVYVKTTVVDGKPSYLMKNEKTGIYYEPDELTNLIWNSIDGKRTVKQVVEEVQRQKPRIREGTVEETLLFFAGSDLLVSSYEPSRKKRIQVVSAFEIDFRLIERSHNFLQSIHRRIGRIFRRPLLWAVIIFIIVGTLLFAGQFVSIFGKKSNFEILGSTVVGFFFYYFVALAPVIAVHEIAHGLALVHYGGQPGEMGAGLFYFGPMFYTETTDAWGLIKRDRMMVYLAGNISTLLIGSVVAIALLIVQIPPPASLILTMIAFYCFNMALFNFAPPFETDGYYILSDALNMPNLRRDSYAYMGSIFKRALGMQSKFKIPGLTKRKKGILIGYSFLSVGWIIYIVFQTSLFLMYMSQDVTVVLSDLFNSAWASQPLPTSTIAIAVASMLYFGMQIVGYGSLFSAAVKKATAKPLLIEALHDRDLAVFAYLPPQAPESLSNHLSAKMEKTAEKFTPNFEIKQIGRSCVAVLRMGGKKLALVQIKEDLKRVESRFSSTYLDLIMHHKADLQESIGILSPPKIKFTTMLEQIAAEAADAGNSGAPSIVRDCKDKQNETILYLLSSTFGTVWTIEVQPAHEYEIQRDILPNLLLEDLTLTDLYGDCENFKKRVVYGFDSLANLVTDIDTGVRESLAQPQEYQLVGIFEPIRSRITFVGRTEQMEKNIHVFAPFFAAQTWSGYMDNLLTETCLTLSTLNQARLPNAREIKEMSVGELAVLTKDLSAFTENKDFVDKCLQKSENHPSKINQSLLELQNTIIPSENFKIGLLDATFQINVENLKALPSRIKEFRKEWKTLCKRIKKIRERVENEYEKRKTVIAKKKRKMLRIYPLIVALSVTLAMMSFIPPLESLRIPLLSVAVVFQMVYWAAFYRLWKSFHTVTKYPSQSFSRIHVFILALIEAVYGYVVTGDVLTPV